MTLPVTDQEQVAPAAPARRSSALVRLLKRPDGLIALIVIAVIVLAGVLAPLIAPFDPNFVDLDQVKAAPNGAHLLGGDVQGRDLFSRLLYGGMSTVYGAVVALVTSLVLGVPAGVASGYFGGATDKICLWISDALQSVPGMIVLLIVAAASHSSFVVIMITVGVFMAPGFFRLCRSSVLAVRAEAYIDAATVAGLSHLAILAKHVVRSVRGPVVIQSALTAGLAMGMQAGLQFLGLGTSDMPSWGASMTEGFAQVRQAPSLLFWPSLALGVTIAALAVLGNALGDVLATRAPAKRLSRSRAVAQAVAAAAPGESGSTTSPAEDTAISVRGLRVAYPAEPGRHTEVVHGIGFDVRPGEVVGLIGESGSGKSQTVFSLLGLLPDNAVFSADELWVAGRRLDITDVAARRKLLGRTVAYVPQEPMSNLDPAYTVGHQLMEPLRRVHGRSKATARKEVLAALARVGITDAERVLSSYPHQLSGGMAQRVLIAGAVASRPAVLVADEPTTALDVTVQAEVLELLRELQREDGMSLVIVTHNFGVVADLCDRVVVMRHGEVIESGTVERVFSAPEQDYTADLIAACLDDAEPRAVTDAAAGVPGTAGPAFPTDSAERITSA